MRNFFNIEKLAQNMLKMVDAGENTYTLQTAEERIAGESV